MKCVVPSQNVKVLTKALHSLGKIGEDLFIEPSKSHIVFRTVNMSESAYASFDFSQEFFSSYQFNDTDNEEFLKCKIAMKSLLVILKLHYGDRTIEWCTLKLNSNCTKVIFQLRYSYGCTKTHFLPILENETLQANYSKDDCQSYLSASVNIISPAAKNFHSTEEEVTLYVTPQKLILKTYLENNFDYKKALRTEICLRPMEFEDYKITCQTSVTFCLKELRAVLFFAEFTSLPIKFYLSKAGKPVIFVVNNETVYEANYVVSTLSESGSSQPLSVENSEVASSKELINCIKNQYKEVCSLETNDNSITLYPQPLNNKPFSSNSSLNELHLNTINDIGGYAIDPNCLNCIKVSSNDNVNQPIVQSLFTRCFNTTFRKQSLPGYDNVLANDSDEVNDSD